MKKLTLILTFFLYSFHSDGQVFAELHIDIFRPKNVKTIYKYFKSQDTLKHIENDHKLLERKTEYYPNGTISSDLKLNFFSTPPQDTCPYIVFTLNKDSTIKSERRYYTSENKWQDEAFYKYLDKYSYEIDYGKNNKVIRTFNSNGKIIREKSFWTKNDFTTYDFVYDSLDRLIQYVCYPARDKRYKVQSLFIFNYEYRHEHDSLFCTGTQYNIIVNEKTWKQMQTDPPKKYDIKNPAFEVELSPVYNVTIFNKRFEIIDERNAFRRQNEPFPGHVTWTRRTYVYEYY